jgi:cytoskeletal protein RodZ
MKFSDFHVLVNDQYQKQHSATNVAESNSIPQNKKLKKRKKFKKSFFRLSAVIVGIVLVLFVYSYATTRNQLMHLKSSSSSAQTETQSTIDKVSKLVVLPAGEPPTLATVSNASRLKNQQFFARAQDGDKLLIYSKSGLGILYRPSTNKIISYSPINLSNK